LRTTLNLRVDSLEEGRHMRTLIGAFHVGDYKTGTTWLQRRAFPYHPELLYLGTPFWRQGLASIIREMVNARDLDFDAAGLRERANQEFAGLDTDKKTLVSSEVLSSTDLLTGENARRTAERIRAVFGAVKIIFVIREQFAMLPSLYSEYVRMGGTLRFREFLLDPLLARWLIARLEHHKAVEMYFEGFGRENVHVGLFDEFLKARTDFLTKIFGFIGCTEAAWLSESSDQAENTSLTRGGLWCKRCLNRLLRTSRNPSPRLVPVDRVVARLLSRKLKQRLAERSSQFLPDLGSLNAKQRFLLVLNQAMSYKLSKLCEGVSFGGCIKVPAALRDELARIFSTSNRLLVERCGLPVDTWGWPIGRPASAGIRTR
jgi:hypothetical protein